MNELRISAHDLSRLEQALLGEREAEQSAVLFASRATRPDGSTVLVVRDIEYPAAAEHLGQGIDHVQLSPSFVARVAKRAGLESLSLVFVHTHPGDLPARFSVIDDAGEVELAAFLKRRGHEQLHAALLLTRSGLAARELGTKAQLRVVSVGSERTVHFAAEGPDADANLFDRQIRAFGEDGQRSLESLRVAIVGLGGTGSLIAQQLVHLGVRNFVLIDPDMVEPANLNRIVGASQKDIGEPKVAVAARYLRGFRSSVDAQTCEGDVVHARVAQKLVGVDVIFGCTDSHGSRSVMQQVAYQYFIPMIDMGSTITVRDGEVTGIFGRVQLLAPGLPCLWCSNLLNAEEIRRDMMTDGERRADPYIVGARVPAPSVVSLNATVVSLAVTMLLGIVAGAPIPARNLLYNARTSMLKPVQGTAQTDCFICSRRGVLGRGDEQALFARQD
ncbi:MAG: HesA/MoeB/ThiF family protein [Hylemonella sp.]|jgi:molybdopterin/thiamine biosynthesis adenylyltransferase